MSDGAAITDTEVFAAYANNDDERWRALIDQQVAHTSLGIGVVTEIQRSATGQLYISVHFGQDEAGLRKFPPAVFSNPKFFSAVQLPAGLFDVEAVRAEVMATRQRQEDERKQREAEAQRLADQAVQAARLARVSKPSGRSATPGSLLEVLSIPAGRTSAYIAAYDVHACPDSYNQYRDTPYITFRQTGGIMWRAYDMAGCHIFTLHPRASEAERERVIAEQLPDPAAQERVRRYVRDRNRDREFEVNEEFRFYVFSLQPEYIIDLPHRPHLKQNFERHTYFSLGELTSGRKVVQTLTQQANAPARRRAPDIDALWSRIQAHAGQEFRQIRGQAFTYEAHEGYLTPSTTNHSIPKGHFAEALGMLPLESTTPLQHLRGPSYIYAILTDPRISHGEW